MVTITLFNLVSGRTCADIPKVGIQTEDGLSSAVIGHVFEINGRIDWRDRDGNSTDALQSKPSDDPLWTIREIKDGLISFGYTYSDAN